MFGFSNKLNKTSDSNERFKSISDTYSEDLVSKNRFQFNIPEGWKAFKDNFEYQSVYSEFVIYSPDYKDLGDGGFEGARINMSISVPPMGNNGFLMTTTEQYVEDMKNDDFANKITNNKKMLTIDDTVSAIQIDSNYEGFGTYTTFIYRDKKYDIRISYPNKETVNLTDPKYKIYRDAYDKLINTIYLLPEY